LFAAQNRLPQFDGAYRFGEIFLEPGLDSVDRGLRSGVVVKQRAIRDLRGVRYVRFRGIEALIAKRE
jgi:hypothetical protein